MARRDKDLRRLPTGRQLAKIIGRRADVHQIDGMARVMAAADGRVSRVREDEALLPARVA